MKYLFLFLIIGFLLIVPYSLVLEAQDGFGPVKTLEEAKTTGKKILTGFPGLLNRLWQDVIAFWQKVINLLKNFLNSYITPWLQDIWQKIVFFLGKEVEQRKTEVQEEFEKEKEEMKEEIKREAPKIGKSIWERFKELIK